MRCPQVEKLLQPFIDGELTASERSEVEAHLGACDVCTEAFEGLQAVDEWACSLLHEEPTDAYLEHLHTQVLEDLERPDPRRAASSVSVAADAPAGQALPFAWGIPLALSLGLVLLAVAVNPLAEREGVSGWFARTDGLAATSTVLPTPVPTSPATAAPSVQPPTQRFQTGRPEPARIPVSQAVKPLEANLAALEGELNAAARDLADLTARIDREAEQERRVLAEGER